MSSDASRTPHMVALRAILSSRLSLSLLRSDGQYLPVSNETANADKAKRRRSRHVRACLDLSGSLGEVRIELTVVYKEGRISLSPKCEVGRMCQGLPSGGSYPFLCDCR